MQNMYHYAIQELNSEEMHEKAIIIYIIQHLLAFFASLMLSYCTQLSAKVLLYNMPQLVTF